MKKVIFTFALLAGSFFYAQAVESEHIAAMDCESYASGFMHSLEIWEGCLDSEEYNDIYGAVLDYCNATW
jgi:hypothetical protein